MSKVHEALDGAPGGKVVYRPARYATEELLKPDAAIVEVGDRRYQAKDLSMNGLCFHHAGEEPLWVEDQALELKLVVGDEIVHCGPARVARLAPGDGGWEVGLALSAGFLDLPGIRRRFDERLALQDIAQGPPSLWAKTPAAYRQIVDRAVCFTQYWRQALQHLEQRYAAEVDSWRASFAPEVMEQLRAPWAAMRAEACQAALPFMDDRAVREAAKRYTETVLTPLLMEAPGLQRSFNKPLGYAGDHHVMLQIYRNGFEGATLFGQVFHKLAAEEPLAQGVRRRKDWLVERQQQEMKRFAARSQPGEEFRIASLGGGPALEVCELVEREPSWPRPVRWTLIDQEEDALSMAYNDIFPRLQRKALDASLHCLHVSFRQLLRRLHSLPGAQDLHFIYVAGLLDYLRPHAARAVVHDLFGRLAPGGLLAVANAHRPNLHFWLQEFVLNWRLFYRSPRQLLALADGLTGRSSLAVEPESSGTYDFLLIRRR